MSIALAALVSTLTLASPAQPAPQAEDSPKILSMRARAEVRDRWTRLRLERVVPRLMRAEGVDMWILANREYTEDPLFRTMSPATWLNARRRTILVFFDRGVDAGVERLAVSRYGVGDLFEAAWIPEEQPDQWAALAAIIAERDPKKIALDYSETFALADGITSTERAALVAALAPSHRERVVSAERLAIRWLETRIDEELTVYPALCRIAHEIIAEGLSDRVIQPGVTTTADVQWWYRERIRDLKLTTWFHPSVSVQRAAEPPRVEGFANKPKSNTILPGDLIHIDFGITYLGLNTDTQQHGYVLLPGETEPPAGLVEGLAAGNRVQDLLNAQFATGRSGNEVLRRTLEACAAENLRATIYTHPLGFHGHAAGPTIGLWDQQGGVPGRGDWPLYPSTAYSIELGVRVSIPEWDGKDVDIMLEEDAWFDGTRVRWLDGRQTELFTISTGG